MAWEVVGVNSVSWLSFVPPIELRTKVSLAFVPLRSGIGSVFVDGSGQLQLHWTVQDEAGQDRGAWVLKRAQLTGYISAQGSVLGDWLVRMDGTGDRPHPGHSVSIAMRGPDLVAMYSAVNWDPVDGLPAGALRAVRYLPYAFGVMPGYAGLVDNDDAAVIDTRMCRPLWRIVDADQADCRCATGQPCGSSPAPLIIEEPLCEPEPE